MKSLMIASKGRDNWHSMKSYFGPTFQILVAPIYKYVSCNTVFETDDGGNPIEY